MIEQFERKGGKRIVGYGMGGKGGSAGRSPVETPDNLHSISYAKIVLLLSEGEIYGPVHVSSNLLKDITLDGTPIANEDGTLNFEAVEVEFRAGTQTQDPIAGFPESEATFGVGVELKSSTPYVQAITNTALSAVRISLAADGLSKASQETGDITGYRVEYKIEVSTDGGAYQLAVNTAFDGKTSQRYTRTHRVELPQASTGWQIKVTRLTANANSSLIADRTIVESLTHVVDAKFRRPMSALLALKVTAKQFQSIPTVGVRCKGILLRVPTNFDPETRTYSGTWDGTFKVAYSNDPAWVVYDIVTNPLYGLGDLVPPSWTDKWSLYQISQWCSVQVSDGKGGTEPRFTCNAYMQTRADAWKVLQDLAGIFFGTVYYASGSITPVADMPKDPVYTYSNSNVKGGKFTYTGSARRTRYTVALTSWNDLTDMGRAKVEVVQDDAGMAKYGLRQTETTAFGCTSQSQAQRMARRLLLTAQRETRAVSFTVGLDGAISMPGQVIRIADAKFAGKRVSGRIVSAGVDNITIDSAAVVFPGDQLTVTLPTGVTETRTVSGAAGTMLTADTTDYTADETGIASDATGLPGSLTTITVTEEFSITPEVESIWVIENYDLTSQTFRVARVSERDGIEFDISAVQHVPTKFPEIDNGTIIQTPPITVIPPAVMPPVASVVITSYSIIDQGVASQVMQIAWPAAKNSIAYDVQWRRDNSEWVSLPRTGSTSVEVRNIYRGGYLARVRAVNSLDVPSVWTSSILTQLDGILSPPPKVTFLSAIGLIFGIRLEWGYPVGPSIIQKTEIWYSQTNDLGSAIKLGDFAYPQTTHTLMGLAAGTVFYFWAKLVDKNGVEGAAFPDIGRRGRSNAEAGEILGYLAQKITETQLSQTLLTRIDATGDAQVAVDQIVSDLAAMYTIKTQLSVDGKTYLAGIGVGVENNAGIIESQVLIAADRFAVIRPNDQGGVSTPFVIDSNQIFMDSAFIKDGTITNAKIGNVIQSLDFVTNSTGWQLNKNGTFQLNGPGGTGRLVITNNVIKVYDSSGVLRVQMGDLSV